MGLKLCPECKSGLTYPHPEKETRKFQFATKCSICGFVDMKGDFQLVTWIEQLEEKETYRKNRRSLMKEHLEKWVLIKKDKILGIYDTELDAVCAGCDLLGPNEKFLVRKIF